MAASALSLSSAYKTSVLSESNPVPPIFFHLKSFLWKGPLTVKVRKKIIDQILGCISFCIEIRAYLGHLFALTPEINKFDRWSKWIIWAKHKVKSYICCVNKFLLEKRHEKWNQECKQKQSLLFSFSNIFDL